MDDDWLNQKILVHFVKGNQEHFYVKLSDDAKKFIREQFKAALAKERGDVRNEVKAKIEMLDKLIMGAGEYHDDPYEYVVPLRHIREYRAELSEFDLTQPVYRDIEARGKHVEK